MNQDKQVVESSNAILLLVSLAILTFWVAYFLKVFKIQLFHESLFSVLVGMIVGLILEASGKYYLEKLLTFNHSYFFNILLPPIILNSGYELEVPIFLKFINPILMFAIVGTFISSISIGVLVFLTHSLFNLNITFLESTMLGSILSSTDPVTVLGIFKSLNVDPQIYSIVVGESMLNDAVSIVLFNTLKNFVIQKDIETNSIFLEVIGNFFIIFLGSCVLGIIFALLTALAFKHSSINKYPEIESCLITLLAYSAYIFTNAIEYSGIVALLFCGVTMKHYTFRNLSLIGRKSVSYMCRVMSNLCETFVFIFLGTTIFSKGRIFNWGLIIFTFIFILLARAISVFPLSWVINFFGRIKFNSLTSVTIDRHNLHSTMAFDEQIIIWWAGLRGAISFALSMDMNMSSANELRTTTLVVVVISILVIGGSTGAILKKFKIGIRRSEDSLEVSNKYNVEGHWFISLDNKYLIPFFTKNNSRSYSGLDDKSEDELSLNAFELNEVR